MKSPVSTAGTSTSKLIVNVTVSVNSPQVITALRVAVPAAVITNLPSTNNAAGSSDHVILTPSATSIAGNANASPL